MQHLANANKLKLDKGVELPNWRVRSQDVVKLIKNSCRNSITRDHFFPVSMWEHGAYQQSHKPIKRTDHWFTFSPSSKAECLSGPRLIERLLDRPRLPWVVMPSHCVCFLPTIQKKVSPGAVARCAETPFKMKNKTKQTNKKNSPKKYRGKSLTYWIYRRFPHGFAEVLRLCSHMHTGQ